MPENEFYDRFNAIERAVDLAVFAQVPVTLGHTDAAFLIGHFNQVTIHLVKVLAVAATNISYAPSREDAEQQIDIINEARDYLLNSGIVDEEMLS